MIAELLSITYSRFMDSYSDVSVEYIHTVMDIIIPLLAHPLAFIKIIATICVKVVELAVEGCMERICSKDPNDQSKPIYFYIAVFVTAYIILSPVVNKQPNCHQ